MSPVSRSGIILNNDTLKQSFHSVTSGMGRLEPGQFRNRAISLRRYRYATTLSTKWLHIQRMLSRNPSAYTRILQRTAQYSMSTPGLAQPAIDDSVADIDNLAEQRFINIKQQQLPGVIISVTRPGPVEDTRPIMSPVSRSGIILNNDTLKQSFHIVSHQEQTLSDKIS